ncbi:restriction endonuclease subunit S [Vibrio parahaemolyticus]|nr:restriction endonuclease subunit S [Vibrio parahaemolyticus]
MTWHMAKFGSVCKFVRGPFGGSLKKSCFKEEGYAVYEQQHAIYEQFNDIRYFIDEEKFIEMSRFELAPNDLIMSCSGTMGKIAIVPDGITKGIINQALLKLTPNDCLLPDFLKLWMNSPNFQGEILSLAQGAAIKNMASVKMLKDINVPIPSHIEQQQIVDLLDKAFADIEQARQNTEQNLRNARELFDSYLQQVFSERGEEWEELTLQNAVSDDCSLSYGVVQPGEEFDGGIPVVRPVDLKRKSIEKSGLKRMDPKLAASYQRTSLSGSELLLCVRGETGTVAVSDPSLFGANVTRGIVPIKFSEEKVSLEFAYFQFLSPLIYRQIKEKNVWDSIEAN